ncbi:MAG: NAD(P)-dependent oxidoreductase [Cyclobacteriaceae bacterium]
MILLTGATGFLGSHLLHSLVNNGHKVIILIRKSSNTVRIDDIIHIIKVEYLEGNELKEIFLKYKISSIIHTATCYGRNKESEYEIFKTNVDFPLQLAHYASENKVATFFNTSSSLPAKINSYAQSKNNCEYWLDKYSSKMKVVHILPEYFYGPNDAPSKFITMLIEKMKNNEAEINLSSCEQKRDFVYITDLISAYETILNEQEKVNTTQKIEIGTGHSVQLKKIVMNIAQIMNYNIEKLKFGSIESRKNENTDAAADIQFLSSLGWTPQIVLNTGIKKTIAFYKN